MFTVNLKNGKKYLTLLTIGIIVSCTGILDSSNHAQANVKSSFITTSSKAASSDLKRYKTTEKVSLFSNASNKSKVLTTIPKSTVLTPINKINGWFKVKYNNKVGWVSEEFLFEYLELKRYQTMEPVVLRNSHSSDSKKILTIPKSKMIMSAIKYNDWHQVRYDEWTGWISGKHLRFHEEIKYFKTNKALTLYSSHSTNSKKLATLSKSTIVSSNKKYGGWYQTSYDKKTGWILAKYIKTYTFPKPNETDYGPLVKNIYTKANVDVFAMKESGSFYGIKKGLQHSYSEENDRFLMRGDNLESYTVAAQAFSKMTGHPDVNGFRLALMSIPLNKLVSYRGLEFRMDGGGAIGVNF